MALLLLLGGWRTESVLTVRSTQLAVAWQWLLLTEWREISTGNPLNRDLVLLSEWRSPKVIGCCDRRFREAMLDRIIILGDDFVGRRDRGRWKERVEFSNEFLKLVWGLILKKL